MASFMDLYPVILAGGHGSRMYPLTESVPKALLPVRNQPLIYYPIKMLQTNGFTEITIVAYSSNTKVISSVLETLQSALSSEGVVMKLTVCEVPDNDDLGSADALLTLRGRIKMDLLVVPCDLVSTVSIQRLLDTHIINRSSLTMLLVRPGGGQSMAEETGKKTATNNTDLDLIGLTSSDQVVYHSALVDVEEELMLTRKMLKRFPHFTMHSKLLDSHVYIMQHWVLDYLHSTSTPLSSLKGEVVPHLVRRQGIRTQQTKGLTDLLTSAMSDIEQLALSYSSCPTAVSSSLRCHALVVDGGTTPCMRVNSIPLYMEANRMSPQMILDLHVQTIQPTTTPDAARGKGISGDTVLGNGVQLSERCSIKRSIIGNHCTVKDKTKIINSVIMDHVNIGENCTIQGCIISDNVKIGDKVNLKDCTVGAGYTINNEAEHKGDILVESAVEL